MKNDEKILFIAVHYATCKFPHVSVREVISIFDAIGLIHHKRSIYLLLKWCKFGFYNYGVSLLTGWIEHDKLPKRYLDLILLGNTQLFNINIGDN